VFSAFSIPSAAGSRFGLCGDNGTSGTRALPKLRTKRISFGSFQFGPSPLRYLLGFRQAVERRVGIFGEWSLGQDFQVLLVILAGFGFIP